MTRRLAREKIKLSWHEVVSGKNKIFSMYIFYGKKYQKKVKKGITKTLKIKKITRKIKKKYKFFSKNTIRN